MATVVRCPSGQCAEDLATISLTGIYLGQTVIAIVAVLMISSEYCTGMIRVTLAAMPRHLEQVGPMTAGLAIQAITGLRSLHIGASAGLGVLAHGPPPRSWLAGSCCACGGVNDNSFYLSRVTTPVWCWGRVGAGRRCRG